MKQKTLLILNFSSFILQRVRFSQDIEVHFMVAWGFAYRNARKGNWEEVARDNARFKNSIEKMNEIFAPVFEQKHRDRIYHERFEGKTDVSSMSSTATTQVN